MLVNINDYFCQGHVNKSNAYLTLKPISPLNNWVQEFWQLNVPDGRYFYRSIPDNCVDMIINLTLPEEAFFVTPFSSAKVFEMIGSVSYFGVRFRILGQQGIISTPLSEWNTIDNITNFNDILPESLLSLFRNGAYDEMSFHKRCEYFSKVLLAVLRPCEVDRRLIRYILYCHQSLASNIDLSNKQCSEFGLSARHLRRLTSQYLGLSPREFAKVFRFQKTVHAMNTEDRPSAWVDCYYDQPHFNRDFKKISGVTPNDFRSMSVLYNTD